MMDYLLLAFEWAKANDNMLGAIGSILALLTLFFTNGALIMRKLFGKPAHATTENIPTINYKADAPEYGDIPAIACLPFVDRGLSDGSFADGLLDDVISLIQKDRSIAAAPRTSVEEYKGSKGDVRRIARSLGVGYVLEGSLREGSEKIRFTVQLLDRKGATIWSDRFDITSDSGLDGQDELAARVTEAIHYIFVPVEVPAETMLDPIEETAPTTKAIAEKVSNDDDVKVFPRQTADSNYNAENDNAIGGIAEGIKSVTSKATAVAKEAHDKLDPETVKMAKGMAASVGVAFDAEPTPSKKSRTVSIFLCLLGLFPVVGGLHRFYVGRPWTGALYLFTGGLFFVGTVLDLIVLVSGVFGDGKGQPVIYWSRKHREAESC